MKTNVKVMLATAGLGGFFSGWLMFGGSPDTGRPTPKTEQAVSPGSSGPVAEPLHGPAAAKRVEFPLRPADIASDRETPAVAVDARGRVVVAWASKTGESECTLTLARSDNGGASFEPPIEWRKVPIFRYTSKSRGKEVSYSTHVLPRLVSSGDSIHLGWVEAIDGGPKVVSRVATSNDGGRSFSEPVAVHGEKAVKPGFTGLAVAADGSILSAWLDGRATGQHPYSSIRSAHSEGFEPEQEVFAGPEGKGVCPCCDVSIAQGVDHSRFVGFRNSDSGNRDIVVCRSTPDQPGFSAPVPVSTSHWKLDGCPHDGPSLAIASGRLHVAWMDAHDGKGRVYLASSPTSELAFSPRELAPHAKGTQGHPRLATDHRQQLVAVWEESLGDEPATPAGAGQGHGQTSGAEHGPSLTGGGRAILLARGENGSLGTPRPISARPGAFQLQPGLAIAPDGTALVVWNELHEHGKSVVFCRISP